LTITKYIVKLLLFLFVLPTNAKGQEVNISGDLHGLPFLEFVTIVEQQTDVHFFFLEDWVREINISFPGKENSLLRILSTVLPQAGLFYRMDEDLQVFIFPEQEVIYTLPDYTVNGTSSGISTDGKYGKEITDLEQRYIESKKSELRETIVIGKEAGIENQSGVVINGKIVESVSGEPLIGATIYVQDLEKGAITDVDGRFSMVLRPGKYSVDFNCMGMETAKYYLEVYSGGNLEIFMDRGLIPIKEVVIEATRFNNVKGMQMGFERLNFKMVRDIPLAFGEKDLLKVAQMLPGVQNVGEGASGFNVRGSAADQNMIYVNRVPVYNSSHLFGFFSLFSPDIVKDFSLYKSNLPANYGGRLSSFFDISTRQGNMNNFTARGGISPITGHIAFEGPVVKNKCAFVLSARSSYSDWILKRLDDLDLRNSNASFYDLAGILTFEPNEKNLIKTFGYYSRDKFSLGSTNQYNYSNAGASINFKHRFSSRISGDIAGVYGEYAYQTVDESLESFAFSHKYRINHYEIRTDLKWLSLGAHKLSFGGNVIYYLLDRGDVKPYGELSLKTPVDLGIENAMETALYFADEITIGPRLTLYGGLRYSYYLALGPASVLEFQEGLPNTEDNIIGTRDFGTGEVIRRYSGPEPRISLNYLLGEYNSVKFSYNRVRQYLFMLTNTIAMSPTDQWKLCDYNIAPPFVDQLSAGYYHDFKNIGFSTSLEAYYKMASNLKEFRDGASFINNPNTELEILQGDQEAYGMELMARKNTGKINGWIAYSYSRSTMLVKSNFPGESINRGVPYPSNYDRPHHMNIVSNLKLDRRFSFSLNMVYTTGRPVTYPVSIYFMDGIQYVYYSERNGYRIPDYFRIDLSVNIEGNLKRKKLAHSFWMLNFYNITGRNNAYSVYFKNEDGAIKGYKLSIFGKPLITLSWNFKFGNYSSE